jgi:hypothetical protein
MFWFRSRRQPETPPPAAFRVVPDPEEESMSTKAKPGDTVLVVDHGGQTHEATIVRNASPKDRPVVVELKDGKHTRLFLPHDAAGKPGTWRNR